MPRQFSRADDAVIRRLAGAWFTADEAAEAMDRDRSTIFGRARRLGVIFDGFAVQAQRKALLEGVHVQRTQTRLIEHVHVSWARADRNGGLPFWTKYLEALLEFGFLLEVGSGAGVYVRRAARSAPPAEGELPMGGA